MGTVHRSVVAMMLGLSWIAAAAAVPGSMDYQGYLTDTGGGVINADLSIEFSIYAVETGGTALWSDTQLVSIDTGLFSVILGSPSNPFPPDLFDTPLYVGINVEGDGEMTPRRALTSVGFAFNADELQGQSAAAYDQSAHVSDTANPHGVTAAQTGAATAADIASLQSQIDTLTALIDANTASIGNNDIEISALQTQANTNAADIGANGSSIANNAAGISANAGDIALNGTAIATINANTVLDLDGLVTLHTSDTVRFSGVDVQITNGTGSTAGPGNGTGNLIVGYDEADFISGEICSLGEFDNQTDCQNNGGTWAISHKSGSHNLVIGSQHNYSRYGGLVAGFNNDITGVSGTVSGGQFNTANGTNSSVSGGSSNIASGNSSSVSGGSVNTASGLVSAISGGQSNVASDQNEWQAANSVLALDGLLSLDSTDPARPAARFDGVNVQIVSGSGATNGAVNGRGNLIVGYDEVVTTFSPICSLGEYDNQTDCESNGGIFASSHKSGSHNIIVGREHNYSRYGGLVAGLENDITGIYASVSGGSQNSASGSYSSIGGGEFNDAEGSFASVGGGQQNSATGTHASVSGGLVNTASGDGSSVSGGQFSSATGINSSVSGGINNTAAGQVSSVSGGNGRSATGSSDWVAGSLVEDF